MFKYIVIYLFLFFPLLVFSQEKEVPIMGEFDQIQDSLVSETFPYGSIQPDSLFTDTVFVDSLVAPVIEAPIDYNAEDSIIVSFDGQKVYLYNNARVNYQQIELTAYFIELDLETKEVYAEGILDSTETLVQKPIFKDGQEEFESKSLRYNFETKKGIITEVVMEQDDGYFHSQRTKKISEDIFLAADGKYTTCDAEHPHFYLHLSKAKVISNNKIVTGPAYMVLEDFPIYFPFLPFGYFPTGTPVYSSGILIPTYGEEANRGFFLRDGGYYWAASQYFDLTLRTDVYSKGSWAGKVNTNYTKRYKFSGNLDFKYNVNKYGEKGTSTYSESPQFSVSWSHRQDAKSNPNQTFSASVNLSSSGYDKQNSVTQQNYLRTQKQSSVSFTKKFENTPFNISLNLRHSQNSRDTTISFILPEMTFNMSKIYPFRSKNRSGSVKWYEKFGMTYTANIKNELPSIKEYEVLKTSFAKDWKNGIKHNLPISLPGFNLFNHLNFSPSFSYNEKWYFKKLDYTYVPDGDFNNIYDIPTVRVDTITGLNRVYDYSYSLSMSTNIYGMFTPLNRNSKIQKIRHKMTPTISMSYRPDFGKERFGYWKPIQIDSAGTVKYLDINKGGAYGDSPGRGASGAISFSLSNSVEMKVLDVKDTTKTDEEQNYKKVKLIDNLSFNTSYNLVADSFNLAPIGIRARTKIAGVNINMGTTLDPYVIDEKGRVNKYAWKENNGISKLGRITTANLSFGMQFSSKKGQEQAEANEELIEEENLLPGDYSNYADFNVPWDFGFDYSFNYRGPRIKGEKGAITQTLGFRGNLNLTEKWRASMTTNFDIMAREFSFTSFNVTRDLHCWQMTFNFIPFGLRRSYSFTINARSSILRDLKLTKNRSFFDNF